MDQIYIDGVQLDTDSSTIIQYDFAVKDLVDITVNKENKTKTIKVNSSNVNDHVFGQYADIASINEFNKDEHTGEIWNNGAIRFVGKVFLLRSSKVGNYKVYEFVLISGNRNWLQNIESLKLKDLQISQYDHTFNETDVSANDQDDTANWCYPFLRYGEPRYNAGMFGWTGYGLNDRNRIALRVARLFELIEHETGYIFQGNILWDDKFTKLWELQAPYQKQIDESMNWEEHQGAALPKFTLNFPISSGGTWYFPVGCQFTMDAATAHMTTGGYFSPATDRVMQIYTSLSYTEAISGATIFPRKARILVDDYVDASNYTTIATIESGFDVEDTIEWTGQPVLFEGGKTYRFRFEFFGYIQQPNCFIEIGNISLKLEIPEELSVGDEVSMVNHVPDISLIDYIKKYQKLFGLYFLANDKTKTVYIEDANRFFQYSNIIDLRAYMIGTEPIDVSDLIGNIDSRELKFLASGDAFEAYGKDHKLLLSNPYTKDASKDDYLSWEYQHFAGFPIWQTIEKIPQLYNYEDGAISRNTKHKERLLYYGGEITLSGSGIPYDGGYLTSLTKWKQVSLDGSESHQIDYSEYHTDRHEKQLSGKVIQFYCLLPDYLLELFLYPMNGHNSIRSVVLFEDTNGDQIYGQISSLSYISKVEELNKCRIKVLTVNPINTIIEGSTPNTSTALLVDDITPLEYETDKNIDYE